MRAAVELGVTVMDHTEVLDIGTSGGAIESVTTQRGVIRTEQVICAAGAWSAKIGEMAGHTLPVVPVRRMIGLTTQMPQTHPTVPFTLDLSTTMYMHNYYNGMLLGISYPQEPNFNRDYSFEWLDAFNSAAEVFAPSLRNRSEEHTSELQSRFDLVCRLLLEKK